MARHFNQSIINNVNRTFGFKKDSTIGTEVLDTIVPTINIQSYCNFLVNNQGVGTSTFPYSISTDKNTYLCGGYINGADDNGVIVSSNVTFTTNEGDVGYLNVYAFNGSDSLLVYYNPPLKLKKGTTINFASGLSNDFAQVWGYTEELNDGNI